MSHILDINKFLRHCTICPRECGVNRIAGEKGFCRAKDKIEVYSFRLHFGEEPPISGTNGSGTIFFNHCSLRCIYCQNYRFSQIEDGKEFTVGKLSELMFLLQGKGAHNINLVTPTHYAVQIANSIVMAKKKRFNLPIVYNSSGYEKIDTLRLLDGLVDVYLVDMRYGDNSAALKYSSCQSYVEVNRMAVVEMHRQVGDLKTSCSGIAEKGIIIRHLIMPNDISSTENVFKFISDFIGDENYISLMSQYYPAYNATKYKELSRKINRKEYDETVSLVSKYNLRNGWMQEYTGDCVDSDFAGTDIQPNI